MTKTISPRRLRVGMAQINTTVGDFTGNTQKVLETVKRAKASGVDLLAFPELTICGYPPEDLILKPKFIEENLKSLDRVTEATAGITAVIGFVDKRDDIYNAAAVLHNGKLAGVYHKIYLPNYGVFDENRYFQAGNACPVYIIGGVNIGINICEDIWYEAGPATVQAYAGAEVIINISASPYHINRRSFRERMLETRARDNVAIIVHNNLVGGQDELVFDGNSMVLDEKGRVIARGKQFEEDLVMVDLDIEPVFRTRLHDPRWRKGARLLAEQKWSENKVVVSETLPAVPKPPLQPVSFKVPGLPGEVYDALVLGTRDYVRKNGFKKAVIGLSGGIDSALVATVTVDALGPENMVGVTMSSRYTATESTSDAGLLGKNLGIRLIDITIEKVFQAYLAALAPAFAGAEPDIAEENIQARIRGNLLMALSNKFGWLVLTTSNKSETATGYTTLYGDMAGGFAVLKDVPKTLVYELARYRNSLAGRELIPAAIIKKEPSAELRPDQKDSDTLPPYDLLDRVLTEYVEKDKSVEQIVAVGLDEAMVARVARLVDRSEYKRRQAPPGIKITPRAFGRDRRLPITNWFQG
ncbi:NAD+ synthase [Chloroflexota bacterium]